MQWYLKALRQYADFTGRARRTEFWMFVLVNVVVSVVLNVLSLVAAGAGDDGPSPVSFLISGVAFVYALAVLIPSIAVTVRRLHDTDRSGWWYFIGLVPLVGAIVLIVFAAQEGTRGQNQYGADPKAEVWAAPTQPAGPAMPA